MNRKKIGALILCFGFILVLAAASAFVIHEAGHDCSGEECPVCRMIAASLSLLRFAGLAVLTLPAVSYPCGNRPAPYTFRRNPCQLENPDQ